MKPRLLFLKIISRFNSVYLQHFLLFIRTHSAQNWFGNTWDIVYGLAVSQGSQGSCTRFTDAKFKRVLQKKKIDLVFTTRDKNESF